MVSEQKFQRGDRVRVVKDLGPPTTHSNGDCEAIIIGSYADQFGRGSTISRYSIFIKGEGEHAWYEDWQLELLEERRFDLLDEWEKRLGDERRRVSNLDWIFKNGREVLSKGYGASIQGLANCISPDFNLWGSRGEGFVYFHNCQAIIEYARPFLLDGDKQGWIELAPTLLPH